MGTIFKNITQIISTIIWVVLSIGMCKTFIDWVKITMYDIKNYQILDYLFYNSLILFLLMILIFFMVLVAVGHLSKTFEMISIIK